MGAHKKAMAFRTPKTGLTTKGAVSKTAVVLIKSHPDPEPRGKEHPAQELDRPHAAGFGRDALVQMQCCLGLAKGIGCETPA